MFLGVPWNIASYALLTHLVAKVTGLEAFEFIHTFGDAHIYENHLDQVAEQLSRKPFPPPTLVIDDSVTSLDGLTPDQFRLLGYKHHPRLSGEVAV
jgi:thymidylate synthase